jgi:hypothetical protein
VVGVGEHFLESQLRLVESPGPDECLYPLAQGHEQQGGVEHVRVVVLDEPPAAGVRAALDDLVVDAVPDGHPARDVRWQAALAGDPDGALHGDPAH